MAAKHAEGEPVTIKKYANRRLYNTATSSYVTLEHLCQMVKDEVDFAVYDAKTGEDITRSVLTQIIVEEEAKGDNLLPIGFLRQIIAFYGDNMKRMLVPQYLDHSMKVFSENQERLQTYFEKTMGNMFPFASLDEMGKQNMAMFERALEMFAPGKEGEARSPGQPGGAPQNDAQQGREGGTAGGSAPAGSASESAEKQVKELQQRLDEMQRQIDRMSK